jgi:hypothetical protein
MQSVKLDSMEPAEAQKLFKPKPCRNLAIIYSSF